MIRRGDFRDGTCINEDVITDAHPNSDDHLTCLVDEETSAVITGASNSGSDPNVYNIPATTVKGTLDESARKSTPEQLISAEAEVKTFSGPGFSETA